MILDNSINISTNILVKGQFKGKYETATYEVGEHQRLSKFEFLLAEVHNASISEDIIPSFETDLFIEKDRLEVEILLGDNSVPDEFRFIEDLSNVRIYDVEIYNHLTDGDKVYGDISGKIVGILDTEEKNIDYTGLIAPNYEIEIVEEKRYKKKDEIEYKNDEWSFDWLWYIFVLILIFGLLYFISQIDYKPVYRSDSSYNYTQSTNNEDYISLKPVNGQKYVTIRINGDWYDFLLDTGASMSTTSKEVIQELIRSGFINPKEHFQGYKMFSIADGSRVRGEIWKIPQIEIGSKVMKNVDFVALQGSDTNLLGMNTLELLGDYVIEPSRNRILIK